jgi:D-alanine-D-alanine ligase
MDKPLAKVVFAAAGLKVPFGKIITNKELLVGEPMPRPFVVKPANEGSSVGVHIFIEGDNRSCCILNSPKHTAYLVEEYITGREITVAVLNDVALGVTEIRPKEGFYDYENKYTDGKTEHLCPAPLAADEYEKVMQMAIIAHRTLGCRGLTRSDFRYDGKDFYILEINTQPGMTALSLSPEIAEYAGISFNQLVQKLVEAASCG